MRFKDADKIHTALETMRLANYPCALNRAKVNDLFNGNPPWSEAERQQNKIFHNANPLYGTRIAHSARTNLNNAFLKPGNYFKVSLDAPLSLVPRHKRDEWGRVITAEINRLLKRQQSFNDMWDQTNAQVVLHGLGPVWWSQNGENPLPRSIGIEDVLVPAQTLLDFSNLEFFGIYRQWTYAELFDMTQGKKVDPGWNMTLVKSLLENLGKQDMQSTVTGNRWLMPEKLSEDLKENAGLFMTSAAPTLFVWDFYFRDYSESDDSDQFWNRRVVLDYQQMQPEGMRSAFSSTAKTNFLYTKNKYVDALSQAIHWQVGNCSNVAPFRYYSVRSLGFLLYAVLQIQNRHYNRFMDSASGNLLELFRNVGEDDRERLEKVDLYHMGIVPDGLSFVTAAERHEVNESLQQMAFAMNKQLMGESSSTYMPEVDTGTDKERTLGEAQIALQTSVSLANGLLNQGYNRATHLYRESARRFCMKGTKNKLAKEFQERCQASEVPLEVLNIDHWDIEPERVLGGGNKAVEGMQANRLMAAKGQYDPDAQRHILRIYTEANTDDPKLAELLVPMDEKPISDATQLATLAMGSLMQGLPVVQKRGIAHVDYVQTMLQLTAQVLQQIEQLFEVPQSMSIRMQKIGGLTNALEHVKEHLDMIAPDPDAKEQVRQFEEELQRQGSALQGFAQQTTEEMQANDPQAQDGEAAKLQAKIDAMMLEAQTRAQNKDADAAQKREHKDAQWTSEERRRDAAQALELERKKELLSADVQVKLTQNQADIAAKDLTTEAEIRRPKPAKGSDK